jgi:hypothetical protein
MIRFACPSCSHIFKTAEENAGKNILCQICKQPVQIPPAIRKSMLGIAVPEKPVIANEEPVAASSQPTAAPVEEEIGAADFQSFQETPQLIETPPPPKSRAGFLAVLALAGLALLLVGGVGGWFGHQAFGVLASKDGHHGGTSEGKAADPENKDDRESQGKAEELQQFREIVKHPFWHVEATEKDINRIIDVILAQKRGAVVFIDDQLYTSVRSGGVFEEMHKKGTIMAPNDMKSERYFYIDLDYQTARPTRREIVSKLRTELDAADHKPDP